MKICLLTTVHSPFDIRIFYKEAKALLKAGYKVTIVAQHNKNEIVDGIGVIPLKIPSNRFERIVKTAWQAYKEVLKMDADIYHFHDPELIPVGLLLKHHRKRVIYDVHEDVPRQNLSKSYIPSGIRKPISIFIEALEAFSSRHFDGIVTATPYINERFLRLGAKTVNVNNYPNVSELYIEENNWDMKEKAVCYVGGIARIRGAYEMIEAIGKTQYKLLLAGDFEFSLEKKLKQLSGWQNVEPLGFIDRKNVKAMIGRSIAGLLLFHPEPNHMDAQPNKMFEYMSAGIPVIASNFPLWREIVQGNECGICVDPLNPEEIANAIRWIIEHPNEAMLKGVNGRKAVLERYNWNSEEEKLLGLYKSLLL